MLQREVYAFPVSLQTIRAYNGNEIPRMKAVCREDTGQVLSVVSDRYTLVTHSQVMDAARGFIDSLGTPEISYGLHKDGTTMMATLTYREHVEDVTVNDKVGLRVYIENSYDASKSVRVYIGALVLSCLNGAVASRNVYNFRARHMGEVNLQFPEPESVLTGFRQEANKWQQFNDIAINKMTRNDYLTNMYDNFYIAETAYKHASEIESDGTLWDLMQALTYHTTHLSPRVSYFGKLNRLEKISKWFDKQTKEGHD